MNGLRAALMWLTALPLRPQAAEPPLAAATGWFGAVGLLVGAAVAATAWLGSLVDAWLGAWLALAVWLGITGFMHLDGLADLADGLGAAHRDRERLLAVMKDAAVGSFGVAAIALLVTGKLVLLKLLIERGAWPLLWLLPAWSRLAAVWWSAMLPPLTDGFAARLRAGGLPASFWWQVALLWLAGLWLAGGLWPAPLLIGLWALFLYRYLGGMNGDCLGAGIEVTELAMMALALLLG